MFMIAVKKYYSVLVPHVFGEDMDQPNRSCKSFMVFGSGAKVSLMSAFNISVRKKKKKCTPILTRNGCFFSVNC